VWGFLDVDINFGYFLHKCSATFWQILILDISVFSIYNDGNGIDLLILVKSSIIQSSLLDKLIYNIILILSLFNFFNAS